MKTQAPCDGTCVPEAVQPSGAGGLRDGMIMLTGTLDKIPGGCSVGGSLEPTAKLPRRTAALTFS